MFEDFLKEPIVVSFLIAFSIFSFFDLIFTLGSVLIGDKKGE